MRKKIIDGLKGFSEFDTKHNIKRKLPRLFVLIPLGGIIYWGINQQLTGVAGQIASLYPLVGAIAVLLTILYVICPTTDTLDSMIELTVKDIYEKGRIFYLSDDKVDFTDKYGNKSIINLDELAMKIYTACGKDECVSAKISPQVIKNMIIEYKGASK